MKGYLDTAYRPISVGIGLGFFSDGALIRGGYGGSGELAQIPVSRNGSITSPTDAIEHAYGAAGLLEKAAPIWTDVSHRPGSPQGLFALARAGSEPAKALMKADGVALGRIAATASTILVLGGSTRNPDFACLIVDELRHRNRETLVEMSQ